MKSTEVLNPRRNYFAVAVFTYYNISPKYCRNGDLWSILCIAKHFDAKCLKLYRFISGNCLNSLLPNLSPAYIRVEGTACSYYLLFIIFMQPHTWAIDTHSWSTSTSREGVCPLGGASADTNN